MASAVIPTWGLIPITSNAQSLYSGRILINVHASGGISNDYWTDPRETDPLMNSYAAAGIPAGVAGNIRFAPHGNNAAFFARYFQHMLVINGVNSETNDHDGGTRVHATGSLGMGYPNLSELYAWQHGKGLPMPWLNGGGMNTSVGLSPATPVPNGNTFLALTTPNRSSATQDFMKEADVTKTLAARAERIRAMQAAGTLAPRGQNVAAQFAASSDSRALLARVAQFIPATFDNNTHVALVAAQAGITTTIQLSSGGFDGHGNIANSYTGALTNLTNMVDYIFTKSADLGLTNRIFVRIYSEFGRTPLLNTGNGKDHWSVGSQVLMEANAPWGNRVFGASGPRLQQLRINQQTGAVDPTNGVIIKPRNIHAALRTYLGIQTSDPKFDLKVGTESFDFFNPAARTGYPNL